MTSDATETPTWLRPELLGDLEVCLGCFRLKGEFEGKEHRCGCQLHALVGERVASDQL
jgi:hypothetical protein